MITKFRALIWCIKKSDIRFIFYEKYSLIIGIICININQIFFGNRLTVEGPYKIWGNIRVLIYGSGNIRIGKNFHAVSARKRSFITLFSPCQFAVANEGEIILGDHVGLNGTTIFARKKISIGSDTMIAPNVIIMDHNGHALWPPTERWIQSDTPEEIKIGNSCWIGMNCIILKGVTIGDGSVIAAGSVVINDVEPACIYAGNPAKKIKSLIDS